MQLDHFTDQRIDEIHRGAPPMTADEREFLLRDTPSFEECSFTAAELKAMTDAELMRACCGVWADYCSCL